MIRCLALSLVLLRALAVLGAPARADCTLTQGGSRPPGTLVHDTADNVVLYCADTVCVSGKLGNYPHRSEEWTRTCAEPPRVGRQGARGFEQISMTLRIISRRGRDA